MWCRVVERPRPLACANASIELAAGNNTAILASEGVKPSRATSTAPHSALDIVDGKSLIEGLSRSCPGLSALEGWVVPDRARRAQSSHPTPGWGNIFDTRALGGKGSARAAFERRDPQCRKDDPRPEEKSSTREVRGRWWVRFR
jgi:hypothetical protein